MARLRRRPWVVFCWWLGFAIVDPAGDWGFDFRQFWQGGRDGWNGVSPYPSAALLATAGDHLGPVGIQEVFRFPYPAFAAVSLAPFGPLAFDLSAAIWGCLLVASLLGSVWVLGVRDWRVFGVVVGSAPVIGAVRIGTLTPVLLLLLAVIGAGATVAGSREGALALAVSLKLFLCRMRSGWPRLGGTAAAPVALVGAVALTLGAWALIGFAGVAGYPVLLRRPSDVVADRGFSLVALGAAAGLPGPGGLGLALGSRGRAPRMGGAAGSRPGRRPLELLGCGRRGDRAQPDRVAPLLHAARRAAPLRWPTLAWPWLLLWVFWLVPAQESHGALWLVLVALAVTVAVMLRTQPRLSTAAVSPCPGS